MTHLFISHSTRDAGPIAQQLSAALEAAGHHCWIAPRDVKPGVPYPGQIVAAIEGSAGLVLLVTPAANESPDVLQEIQLASTARKTIAPVIVSGCAPGADLRYFLGVRHQIPWTSASATTTDLLRSFPTGSAWAPSLAQPAAEVATAAPNAPNATDRCDVFMIAHGPSKINVIKVLREYTGGGLAETKMMIESGLPPIRVGHGMLRSRAEAMVKDLTAQGATMMPLAAHKAQRPHPPWKKS